MLSLFTKIYSQCSETSPSIVSRINVYALDHLFPRLVFRFQNDPNFDVVVNCELHDDNLAINQRIHDFFSSPFELSYNSGWEGFDFISILRFNDYGYDSVRGIHTPYVFDVPKYEFLLFTGNYSRCCDCCLDKI